ncbi:MAG: tetratricopeptide repeat protein [Saprospiraceae bacterium]
MSQISTLLPMTNYQFDRIPKKYLLVFLFLTACLFYGNSLLNGYNLDDELVTQNHALTSQGVKAIPEIFSSPFYQDAAGTSFEYRPVLLASFALEHQLFGESPMVSHAVNVLIYGLTALLIFWLAQAVWNSSKYILPFLASLLFVVHPIHTETVNNIKSRDELLALCFSLIASLLFLNSAEKKRKVIFFVGGGVAFALAIMSKLSALPFALLIPVSLVLFRRVSFVHLLTVSVCLVGISFTLFSQSSIIPPMVFYAGLIIFPLLLYVMVNFEKIAQGFWQKAGLKYLKPDSKLTPIWSGLILSALFFMGLAVVLNNPVPLIVSLASIGLLFFTGKEKRPFVPSVLLAGFGLFSAIIFRSDFIHIICFMPLLIYALSEDWKTNRLPLGVFLLLFLAGLLNDILNSEGWGLMNIIAFALLYFIGKKYSPKINFVTLAVMLFFSIILLSQGKYELVTFWISAGVFLLLEINKKRDSGFRVTVVVALLLGIFIFLSSPRFVYDFNGFYPAQELTAQPPVVGQRMLDFSENPILYEPSGEKRVATSLLVAGKYLQQLLFPYPLHFYYGYNTVPLVGFKNTGVLMSVLAILFLVVLAFYNIRKRPLFVYSSLLLLMGVFQFSNLLIPVAGIMGERLVYTASLGFSILLALSFLEIHGMGERKKIKFLPAIFWSLIGVFFFITFFYVFHRNQQWKSPLTLYKHDVQYLSHSAKAHNILANESFKQALLPENINQKTTLLNEAVNHFKKCIEIYPKFPFAWLDLGNAYLTLGDPTAALSAFESSTKVDNYHGESYFKTAGLYESSGDYVRAEEYYLLAIEKNPQLKEAYINLSAFYFSQQVYDKGLNICDSALKIWPDEYGFLINKGNAMASLNQYVEAIGYFEKALLQQPSNIDLIKNIIYLSELIGDINKAETYRKMLQ